MSDWEYLWASCRVQNTIRTVYKKRNSNWKLTHSNTHTHAAYTNIQTNIQTVSNTVTRNKCVRARRAHAKFGIERARRRVSASPTSARKLAVASKTASTPAAAATPGTTVAGAATAKQQARPTTNTTRWRHARRSASKRVAVFWRKSRHCLI